MSIRVKNSLILRAEILIYETGHSKTTEINFILFISLDDIEVYLLKSFVKAGFVEP